MYQFKVTTGDLKQLNLEIVGEEAHHIVKVLRLKEGTKISLFDGLGNKAIATLMDVNNESVRIQLQKEMAANTEPPLEVTLYQSMPKRDKLELIIQKATELGIKNIVPIITKRTVVHIDNEKSKKKVERWNKIAQEACKQCGRSFIPHISEPIEFKNVLSQLNAELLIIPYESEANYSLKQVLRKSSKSIPKSVGIFIGPEGGWEKDEIHAAVENGVQPVGLGPRILRTETASLAVLTIVLYELGDLGG